MNMPTHIIANPAQTAMLARAGAIAASDMSQVRQGGVFSANADEQHGCV